MIVAGGEMLAADGRVDHLPPGRVPANEQKAPAGSPESRKRQQQTLYWADFRISRQ